MKKYFAIPSNYRLRFDNAIENRDIPATLAGYYNTTPKFEVKYNTIEGLTKAAVGITRREIAIILDRARPETLTHQFLSRDQLLKICFTLGIDPISDYHKRRAGLFSNKQKIKNHGTGCKNREEVFQAQGPDADQKYWAVKFLNNAPSFELKRDAVQFAKDNGLIVAFKSHGYTKHIDPVTMKQI